MNPDLFTLVSNIKAIVQLVMEILHFKDLGDTECRLFGSERSSSARRVSHCNSNVPRGGGGVSTLI